MKMDRRQLTTVISQKKKLHAAVGVWCRACRRAAQAHDALGGARGSRWRRSGRIGHRPILRRGLPVPQADRPHRTPGKEEDVAQHTYTETHPLPKFGGGQRTRHPPARRRGMTHRAFVPRSACLQRTGPNGGTHHPLPYRRRGFDTGLSPFPFNRPPTVCATAASRRHR